MKKLLLSMLFVFSFSTMAQVQDYNLVAIADSAIKVVTPGPMLAVQPSANVEFTFRSCRKFDFELIKEESLDLSNTTNLKIVAKSLSDCRAGARARTYSLQVSSDYAWGDRFVILNPVAASPY